jgi:hypothetical protein
MIKLKNLILESDAEEVKQGFRQGRQDFINDYQERDLSQNSPSFVLGYQKGLEYEKKKRGGRLGIWWDKMNDRLTDWLARLGSSRLR